MKRRKGRTGRWDELIVGEAYDHRSEDGGHASRFGDRPGLNLAGPVEARDRNRPRGFAETDGDLRA